LLVGRLKTLWNIKLRLFAVQMEQLMVKM